MNNQNLILTTFTRSQSVIFFLMHLCLIDIWGASLRPHHNTNNNTIIPSASHVTQVDQRWWKQVYLAYFPTLLLCRDVGAEVLQISEFHPVVTVALLPRASLGDCMFVVCMCVYRCVCVCVCVIMQAPRRDCSAWYPSLPLKCFSMNIIFYFSGASHWEVYFRLSTLKYVLFTADQS